MKRFLSAKNWRKQFGRLLNSTNSFEGQSNSTADRKLTFAEEATREAISFAVALADPVNDRVVQDQRTGDAVLSKVGTV